MKMRYFLMLKVFSNFEWFKSNLENGTSSTKLVFSIYFLIIHSECRKWYGVGKPEQMQNFLVYIVSPNSLQFDVDFENGLKRIFAVISTNFVGTGQIIYC